MLKFQKLTTRVFVGGSKHGGNPLTIFWGSADATITPSIETSLAQSCGWESVLIRSSSSSAAKLKFFVPSGKELSFCLHAAMGAAYALARQQPPKANTTAKEVFLDICTSDDKNGSNNSYKAVVEDDSMTWLKLHHVPYHEESIELVNVDALLNQLNLDIVDVHSSTLPLNVGIFGRPKTMVRLNELQDLQETCSGTPENVRHFESNCITTNDSTGLYLYAETSDDQDNVFYECRQFPKASGYPEDPATGIAAAALALHLSKRSEQKYYEFRQGTAMGRPSLITIRNINTESPISLECGGQVELDKEEEIIIFTD
mmetsp:Transcript_7806/g.11333  ORF Transcript_7806/g.11333 Transcript_7806/m.11333 type:complete len:315 (-) Transcript_7806:154-1098(-)|eukprot:CAMPEP_0194218136 /NCGR_PEP_ID=MMETSP0156-20130528/23090_1 /TAXON_ID=33649 /ORGANISM="Thalassionema nitzschioides, Strain L26-B" /LENGTH=314 /DNA_ID=CAMNT_0038947387 /DNA_START=56 /DNA_END=1000 /DNA_ORIENTATION=-